MFTRLWTSVQKYLSIRLQQLKDLSPATRRRFIFIAFVPAILVWLIMVAFPVIMTERIVPADDPVIRELTAAKAELGWITARYENARTDSITLSLNLSDSTLVLEIRGVMMRSCPVREYRLNGPGLKADSLAVPFVLEAYHATTEKIPIVVKKAPKDTVEAAKELLEPVLPIRDDVFVWLNFNRDLEIIIRQTESPGIGGWFQKHWAGFIANSDKLLDTFKQSSQFELPSSRREIVIVIDREDARAVYRALPAHSALALLLPTSRQE